METEWGKKFLGGLDWLYTEKLRAFKFNLPHRKNYWRSPNLLAKCIGLPSNDLQLICLSGVWRGRLLMLISLKALLLSKSSIKKVMASRGFPSNLWPILFRISGAWLLPIFKKTNFQNDKIIKRFFKIERNSSMVCCSWVIFNSILRRLENSKTVNLTLIAWHPSLKYKTVQK